MKEKILLAISDVVLTNILVNRLQEDGYKTYTAQDGKEALDKMKSLMPDLVLVDIVLSGKNGYDVLQEKSFDRLITKIPVIIISNSGVPIKMRLIPSTPMIKDYVIKTHIEPDEVLEKIAKIFSRTYTPRVAGSQSSRINNSTGKKILWVEDDKLLSNILSKKFEATGYSLFRVVDGERAFEYLAKDTPNVIILDIILPKMNGLDVLQKIRMDEKLRKIPVIMLSNMSKQSDIEKAKILGAQKFMVKAAVSLDEIVTEVANQIENKHQ
jgi:DNA-binding response OmpR family regulator